MVSRGNEKVLAPTVTSYIGLFDVVFIDECSMIGEQLWHWIEEASQRTSTWHPLKLILMGDPAQLNPVNEGRSPAFNITNKAVLTQVVRQGTDSPTIQSETLIMTQALQRSRGKTAKQKKQTEQPTSEAAIAQRVPGKPASLEQLTDTSEASEARATAQNLLHDAVGCRWKI